MLESFKNLKKFQLTEYISLALFAFVLPMSWHIATFVMIAIFLSVILKGIFEEGFKVNKFQYRNRVVYFLFIAFWLIYAISFLYSENSAEARIQIGKKLSFLLFPLFFLTSDLSYLTKDRERSIMYCFVIGILFVYFVNLILTAYDIIFNDKTIDVITQYNIFFKTKVMLGELHRGYFSIMTCMALVFCFIETFRCKNIKHKIFNLFSLLIFALSPFYVTSRAGILCTLICLGILWIWLTFVQKERKSSIITGIILFSTLIIGYFAFPKSIDRFEYAIAELKKGKGNVRITIRNACKNIIKNNFIFGVGAGDRSDETINGYIEYKENIISNIKQSSNNSSEEFESNRKMFLDSISHKFGNKTNDKVFDYAKENACKYGCDIISTINNLAEYQLINHSIKTNLNVHNQFYDIMISVGILGTSIIIALLIMPIYLCARHKKIDMALLMLLFIVSFNCLFESVFERQMGIMFFTFFYFLLFHAAFCQNDEEVYN